jgi:hypothetical protein
MGGLGNQMFQYAAGRQISVMRNTSLKLDVSGFAEYDLREYLLHNFKINAEIASEKEIEAFQRECQKWANRRAISKLFSKAKFLRYKEPRKDLYKFKNKLFALPQEAYIEGHWVHPNYFLNIRNLLVRELRLLNDFDARNHAFFEMIRSSRHSVSLHVRRGDYVNNPKTNQYHGVCSLEYYQRAIGRISEKYPDATFFIFSDDLDWVRDNLPLGCEHRFVDANSSQCPHFDMALLMTCDHHIIANSTFSWWGAWLADSPDKVVIAPRKWIHGRNVGSAQIVPREWETM